MIQLPELNCKRCGHIWIPRKKITIVCPRCHSPYWDKPRVRIIKVKK